MLISFWNIFNLLSFNGAPEVMENYCCAKRAIKYCLLSLPYMLRHSYVLKVLKAEK